MIISCLWLTKYITMIQPTDVLKKTLTFSGIEVEGAHVVQKLPETVVSARILSADKVEGSDHLRVCKVDCGSEVLQVVCGAPNCRRGFNAILALPGTTLGDIKIEKTFIRGIESNGMLCSEKELGISDFHDGIVLLPDSVQLGLSVNEIFNLPDTVIKLEITPNRSDLLGYIGIARDLSASTGIELTLPEPVITEGETSVESVLEVVVT
ncbi:MAG: phenylalanine--tRNA ligase subunit beta, partial [Candidatus Cloacimonadaceae bacterium]|nr:phenylalanine--tRNA ligase subunit beta [Candidatus Cloacimonadaceae bacterium]